METTASFKLSLCCFTPLFVSKQWMLEMELPGMRKTPEMIHESGEGGHAECCVTVEEAKAEVEADDLLWHLWK